MLLAQPLSLTTLVIGKVALRTLVLLVLTLLLPICAILLARLHGGRHHRHFTLGVGGRWLRVILIGPGAGSECSR